MYQVVSKKDTRQKCGICGVNFRMSDFVNRWLGEWKHLDCNYHFSEEPFLERRGSVSGFQQDD